MRPTKGHNDQIGSSVLVLLRPGEQSIAHHQARVISSFFPKGMLCHCYGWLQGNMRISLFVVLALVGVLLAEGTGSGYCVHFSKLRAKPREIRGFQGPDRLSVALGFGKREAATKYDKFQKIMMMPLQNSPESIAVNWFLQELRKHPELARRIVRRLLESNNDEDNPSKPSKAESSKSERTISFF